jgi:3-keto-disaccharide hydrolase
MRPTPFRFLPFLALVFGLAGGLPTSVRAGDKDEQGFVRLFDGKDFSGFKFFPVSAGEGKTWFVKDGIIVCTGKPNGYLYTDKSYRNYVLRLDFRYPKKAGNSGFLIHITPPHKVFPRCVEVQGGYGGVCSIFPISGLKGPRNDNGQARKKAIKPADQWNSVEIVSRDGVITSYLNGQKIAEAGPYEVKEGPIGFQSEGADIHFRNIRIKEVK